MSRLISLCVYRKLFNRLFDCILISVDPCPSTTVVVNAKLVVDRHDWLYSYGVLQGKIHVGGEGGIEIPIGEWEVRGR